MVNEECLMNVKGLAGLEAMLNDKFECLIEQKGRTVRTRREFTLKFNIHH
jgi:hypothetical protein